MPRFRKSKASRNTPAPTSTSPAELVKKGDSGALATLSAGIALSIGSATDGPGGTSGDTTAVRGPDAILKTTYSAVRMAVEITKESSDLCLPLKAVVGAVFALMKNYDQTTDNAEKMKDVERRVQSLYGVLASPAREDDRAENARRVELRRKLDGVIAKLEPLSEEHVLLRFLRNVDNAKVLGGFVQELADAVEYYQVALQQGVYERTGKIHHDTKDICDDTKNILSNTVNILGNTTNTCDDTKNILEDAVLEKLEPVRNAGYQAGHHDKCLPGTRESVLKDLMLWAKNPWDMNVFWLNGLAGTGKSTITQSFSEAAAKEGLLGASFFCSRDYLDRRELKHIFPTLAYQLAHHYPHFRNNIIPIIKGNPTLAHTSLISQLENLLVNPLSKADISCVIVIDALDECIDNEPSSAILSVLGQFVKQLSLVKFFITGRPEPRIRTGFRLPLLQPITQIFLLHDVDLTSVNKDIQLYLTERLTKIAKQRSDLDLPNPWPHDSEIEALTKKSSGLFIFASTMVRFIESGHHEPDQRLQLLLSEVNSTIHEGHAGIDSLYSQILQYAFSEIHTPEEFANIRHVLGAIVLAFNPLSQRELSTILDTSISLISSTLRHLHSVILVPSDKSEKIRIFHKSFPDFLQDDKRCTNTRFHINPETYHGDMALSCLELLKDLKRNPCSLPPFSMNQDIHGLLQLLEDRIGGAIQYACTYWAEHLRLSPTSGDLTEHIADLATNTLQNSPPWIEVMSLQNQLGEVIHSMNSLLDWLDKINLPSPPKPSTTPTASGDMALDNKVTLHDLATDCLRLTMHFFHPIQQSAEQIYHTALPLSPTSSCLQNSYLQSAAGDQLSHVTAFIGAPSTWWLLLRIINTRPRKLTCIATSGQGIIAACEDIVNIYDAVTGVLQQSLSPSETVTKIQASPDGSTLFFAHSSSVTMWDMQTGGLIHTFTIQSEVNDIAISTPGDHIACGSSNGSVRFWNTRTKKEGKGFGGGQQVVAICWLQPQKLAVATQNSLYIHAVTTDKTLDIISIPDQVWGMVYLGDKDEFLVGTLNKNQNYSFEAVSNQPSERRPSKVHQGRSVRRKMRRENKSPTHPRQSLVHPTLVGKDIACITLPMGVQLFETSSYDWTHNPPLLGTAASVAVSLNRNLVVQTKDSIQIFSTDVLTIGEARNDTRVSDVYLLDKNHIICVLRPTKALAILELETLRVLHRGEEPFPFKLLLPEILETDTRLSLICSDDRMTSRIFASWKSGSSLCGGVEIPDKYEPLLLYGLSPACTMIAALAKHPGHWEIWVKDTKNGELLARVSLENDDLESVGLYNIFFDPETRFYDIVFDSETRLYLKIDGPGRHVQVPYDISPKENLEYGSLPSSRYTITKGEPMPLSEPRAPPPYTLDANCEWVLDAQSRKICWISPGNLRRGSGGHFLAGPSLVMVGNDGVMRKVSLREPDH